MTADQRLLATIEFTRAFDARDRATVERMRAESASDPDWARTLMQLHVALIEDRKASDAARPRQNQSRA